MTSPYQHPINHPDEDNPDLYPTVEAVAVASAQPSTYNPQAGNARQVASTTLINDGQQPNYPQNNQNIQMRDQNPHMEYDPNNVQYQPCTVDQWSSIPNEKTEYSQFWDSPDSFQPNKFSQNEKVVTRCNDLAMAIIFIVVFLLTIAMFAYTWTRMPPEDQYYIPDYSVVNSINKKLMWKCIGLSVAISLVFNIVHDIYCFCVPVIYIKAGMWLGIIFAILSIIAPLYYGYYVSVIFPIIMLIFSIFFYCISRKYFEMSGAILKETCKLLLKYPSIFVVEFFEVLFMIALQVMFSLFIFATEISGISKVMYVFIILTYFWITITFSYIIYMSISGVASSWYFLYNTEYMPKFPILGSLKRAFTTSLGSAAFAGLLLAIVEFLEFLISEGSVGGGCIGCALSILRCIALCVLRCLQCCIQYINRYALVYCATFGVPYKEGCRRFMELKNTRFANLVMNSCIISQSTNYNMYIFSIGAALTAYGIGYGLYRHDSSYAKVFMAAFTFAFAFALFELLRQPFVVISDTLLVCFVENPECLKSSAADLYELLREFYDKGLNSKLHSKK